MMAKASYASIVRNVVHKTLRSIQSASTSESIFSFCRNFSGRVGVAPAPIFPPPVTVLVVCAAACSTFLPWSAVPLPPAMWPSTNATKGLNAGPRCWHAWSRFAHHQQGDWACWLVAAAADRVGVTAACCVVAVGAPVRTDNGGSVVHHP